MFVLVLILLFKVWGDCVNPTNEDCTVKTTSGACNAAKTGCRYDAGNAGTCSRPTADTCAAKAQSSCNSEGCTWSSAAACVRTSHPECTTPATGGCSTGCEAGLTQRIRCISNEEAKVIMCAQQTNQIDCDYTFICKFENSKCVPKTDMDVLNEHCLSKGVGNGGDDCQLEETCDGSYNCGIGGCTCSGTVIYRPTECKVVGGDCKGRTEAEYEAAKCAYLGTGGCAERPDDCKVSGANCVPTTPQEWLDYQCANEIPFANCTDAEYSGICRVVGGACVGDPAYLNRDNTVVCSLDAAGTACENYYDCTTFTDYPCVLKSCVASGGACSTDSVAAGCEWQGSGSCGVNNALTCGPANQECNAANVTAGCVSTAPVTAACLPKAELECAGAGKCSSTAESAGCKTVTKNDDSSASAIAIPVMVFVVLALFL